MNKETYEALNKIMVEVKYIAEATQSGIKRKDIIKVENWLSEHPNGEYTDEDYDMLARENKAMAHALKKLGYTDDQISDIANGAI